MATAWLSTPGSERRPGRRKRQKTVITAICLSRRLALLSDDRTIPIRALLDFEMDETEDPGEAVYLLAGDPDTGWWEAEINAFRRQTKH